MNAPSSLIPKVNRPAPFGLAAADCLKSDILFKFPESSADP